MARSILAVMADTAGHVLYLSALEAAAKLPRGAEPVELQMGAAQPPPNGGGMIRWGSQALGKMLASVMKKERGHYKPNMFRFKYIRPSPAGLKGKGGLTTLKDWWEGGMINARRAQLGQWHALSGW